MTPASVLMVQHRHHRLLVPAGKASAAEILAGLGIDPLCAEFGTRNQIARRAIRVRPRQRVPLHLAERRDPAVGPHIHHRDIRVAAVLLLRHHQRHHIAVALQPGGGIRGRAHIRALELLRREGLDHPGIVSGDQQLHRHVERGLHQFFVAIDARQPVGVVLAAEQADPHHRYLLCPVTLARLRHLLRQHAPRQHQRAETSGGTTSCDHAWESPMRRANLAPFRSFRISAASHVITRALRRSDLGHG